MTLAEAIAAFGPVGGVMVFMAFMFMNRQPKQDPMEPVLSRLDAIEDKLDLLDHRVTDGMARLETDVSNLKGQRR